MKPIDFPYLFLALVFNKIFRPIRKNPAIPESPFPTPPAHEYQRDGPLFVDKLHPVYVLSLTDQNSTRVIGRKVLVD